MTHSIYFVEGHENAKLQMGDPMFGFNPYDKGTIEHQQWEEGFTYAFTKGNI